MDGNTWEVNEILATNQKMVAQEIQNPISKTNNLAEILCPTLCAYLGYPNQKRKFEENY